jgi:galactose mutarotase-like enzyme
LENDFLKIAVTPKGAELLSIVGKSDGHQYLRQGAPAFWKSRAPVLFPIIGNLYQRKYFYNGKEYLMQRHSFAAQSDFECGKSGPGTIGFYLVHNQETLPQYPFEFHLSVDYQLQKSKTIVGYRVENTGPQKMWFSIGGHPGCHCGLNSQGKKDGRLIFEKHETVAVWRINQVI